MRRVSLCYSLDHTVNSPLRRRQWRGDVPAAAGLLLFPLLTTPGLELVDASNEGEHSFPIVRRKDPGSVFQTVRRF